MQFVSRYESPIGSITMASDGEALIGVWFDQQKYDRATLSHDYKEDDNLPVFVETRRWFDIYFSGVKPDFTPHLRLSGSPFRQMVGEIMLGIPYGTTTTYGDIAREVARRMGRPSMSAQAVGGAVGHNPISIIVPCHRVMGADGSITGYAGGIDRKQFLLELEL